MPPSIRVEKEGPVGTLTMERRERFNAMDCEMARDFRKAMELALLTPRLSAQEALAAGLVNRVFANDRFEEEVRALALRVAEGPTKSFGVTKMLLNQSAGVDRLDYHLDQELENLAR